MNTEIIETKKLYIGDIEVILNKKHIKHIHLNILPPDGTVRVSAPISVSEEVIRTLIIKKLTWIQRHIKKFKLQERQTERIFVSGESHYLRGRRYILRLKNAKRPMIEIKRRFIYFHVPENYTTDQKKRYYENWLRAELKKDLEILVPKWEKIMGLKAEEVRIKKMKTKWGSCNPSFKRIWINLELIKKPQKHLEYVIVHELAHLIETRHNKRFQSIMDKYMPNWRIYKKELNEFIL